MTREYDLEQRLIEFATDIIDLTSKLPKDIASKHMATQLLRSGTSPALNYGEAQASESKRDFVHKMRICLKELRESSINLQIIIKSGLANDISEIQQVLKECTELVAIFTTSIKTASKKL